MAGHSRSKNGVASLAYVPAIHVFGASAQKAWMPGTSPGMTLVYCSATLKLSAIRSLCAAFCET
jgi:hypothetical protein